MSGRLHLTPSAALALALAAITGCGRIAFDPLGGDGGDGDGSSSDSAADARVCTAFGPWSVPQRVPELSTGGREYVGQIMPDHVTLYFSRDDLLFLARRPGPSSQFGTPQQFAELGDGCCPTLSRDEREIYFETARAGTVCIFRATRSSSTAMWSTPVMVPGLCGGGATEGPYLTPDGLTLYFNTATPPTDYLGTLMVTTRASTAASFPAGTPVAGTTGGATKGYPTVSVDGLTIRYETLGPTDLYEATRGSLGAAFGTAVPIAETNTSAAEQDHSLTDDGLELFFASDRISPNNLDLYTATRSCL